MASKRLSTNENPWIVLNYAVSEPNEWTAQKIADDLGQQPKKVYATIKSLVTKGFVVRDRKIGNAKALLPTPEGVQALYEAI